MSVSELLLSKVQTLDEHAAREVLDFIENRLQDADEDARDLATALQALEEPGENTSWEEIQRETGLL